MPKSFHNPISWFYTYCKKQKWLNMVNILRGLRLFTLLTELVSVIVTVLWRCCVFWLFLLLDSFVGKECLNGDSTKISELLSQLPFTLVVLPVANACRVSSLKLLNSINLKTTICKLLESRPVMSFSPVAS